MSERPPTPKVPYFFAAALALLTTNAAAATQQANEVFDPPVVATGKLPSLSEIVSRLDDKRVVFVGETHDRYDHHLVQLEVLKMMHQRHRDIAVGVEWFQFPFQRHLDDYFADKIKEAEMLDRTGYYDRWRYDYRLYRPIVEYARANGIPLIALNAPAELTQKIGEVGIGGLPEKFKSQLPGEYDRSDSAYAQRLRRAFEAHPNRGHSFENFLDVMLTWDETMAERAAQHLLRHPGRRMVVMAGSGHVAEGSGIPGRLERRIGAAGASILVGIDTAKDPRSADYLVLSPRQDLPPAPLLGAYLEPGADGLHILRMGKDSALQAAGLEKGDILLSVDEQPMTSFAAVKLALLPHTPGDDVKVRYRRSSWIGSDRELSVEVKLRAAPPPMAHGARKK